MKQNEIRICDFTVLSGRNLYSHRPVVKMVVDIGKYHAIATKEIPHFNQRLLQLFPGLKTNCCCLGYAGGFLERLRQGTYLAHVLEHVILEMQAMLGYDMRFGKTRLAQVPSLYRLVYEYENEVCGVECGKAAVVILNRLLAEEEVHLQRYFQYLKKVSQAAQLGPSTQAIVEEARRRGIPVTRIGNGSLVRLGYGRHSRLVEATLTDATSCVSADIAGNKQLTKHLLSQHKIPVPYGKVVYSELSAQMAAAQLGMPVVIKPFNANQGKGVHLNLTDNKAVRAAFRDACRYSNGIIVEQYVEGQDYRLLVVGDKVRAAAQRIPACVTGDSLHTVRELVKLVNQDPRRGNDHEKPLTKIRLDGVALELLRKQGLSPDSVVPQGQRVFLRENGNLSTGGTAVDCTDQVHPVNAQLAVQAARAVGIDIAGVDFVTRDISQSILDSGGVIVEVNAAPGIRMHMFPSQGQPRNVAADIVDLLFPPQTAAEFPIVSVTGTNGKTTVARLIQHVLMETGRSVGLTSTWGSFVNHRCISRGDNAGPRSARCLLSCKDIDAAVLETARGGILREGLGYDLAHVGVITNITGDHLGLDGADTLEDLINIKSLVAEAVRRDGACILNADDPSTPAVLERVKAQVILFSRQEAPAKALKPDCARLFVKEGILCLRQEDGTLHPLVPAAEVPITWGGILQCNMENALCAAGALFGLNLPLEAIRTGLMSFTENTGRFQLFALNGLHIMLDYGHNPSAFDRVLKDCTRLSCRRMIGVVGMPGDRRDEDLRQAGALCASVFSQVYLKEDANLRGRPPGQAAALLREGLAEAGFPNEKITLCPGEEQALEAAIAHGLPGDLILVFYESYEPLQARLEQLGATPLSPGQVLPNAIVASDWRQTIV